MKLETSFLRSKVARRIFFLFVLCALLPITALSVITYINMESQLREQSEQELIQASKSMAMTIFERLLLIEAEMRMISSGLNKTNVNPIVFSEIIDSSSLSKRFKSLALITESGEIQNLFGSNIRISTLVSNIKKKTFGEETLVLTQHIPGNQSRVFAAFQTQPGEPKTSILIAEIIPTYLWFFGVGDPLPNGVELNIMDKSKNIIFSSHAAEAEFTDFMSTQEHNRTYGLLDWTSTEGTFIASYRSIFMKSRFVSPDWIIVVSKSKSVVFAPLSNFKMTFPPIILITFWVVLLLSFSQIRRNMDPLTKLKEGTRRIAKKDFESRIEVKSRDEFEDVALSFNSMASQLGRQFKTLTAMVDIDRAVLSALDTEKIVATVLSKMSLIFPCKAVSVSLLNPNEKFSLQTYVGTSNPHYENHLEHCQINNEEIQQLKNKPETLIFSIGDELPYYLEPLKEKNLRSFLVLPLFIQDELSGIISMGYSEEPVLDQEDINQARQLTDQVAVALSNAKLIDELNQFNLGTLTALARAIDAKSSWTAGHSERVTKFALQIGMALGLSSKESEVLHRGGLLHDIGKLGVPLDILDKPGKLNAEERALMQKHVLLGARILEPISAYKEIMPIVLEHHENFNGTGYPYGISGEDISLYARIVAVADRFEALTSNRPYRRALDQSEAIDFIRNKSGEEFDPRVAQAFLSIIR